MTQFLLCAIQTVQRAAAIGRQCTAKYNLSMKWFNVQRLITEKKLRR